MHWETCYDVGELILKIDERLEICPSFKACDRSIGPLR